MAFSKTSCLTITPNKTGARRFTKVSYPIRYGRYGEIKTPEATFQFNLNHEIKYIQGHTDGWPSPVEWLKRTMGNDWVYYLAGDYSGVRDAFGEYYLPYPFYISNSFVTRNPFIDQAVSAAMTAWPDLAKRVPSKTLIADSPDIESFLQKIDRNHPAELDRKAQRFHDIIGGPISVLPPDTRHVDYDVIPVVIADGCQYHCGFCRVKSNQGFSQRTRGDILDQINALKAFYGPDLCNYNAIFVGQHDALFSDPDLLLYAAKNAYEIFELNKSLMAGCNLFLFGSVDALIEAKQSFFKALQALPFSTYINIGFESADPKTLQMLKKPITAPMVERAFTRMLAINRQYDKIEITANFVYGDQLPSGHLPSFFELVQKHLSRPNPKGTIYFSPLLNSDMKRHDNIVRRFYRIKTGTPLPCYLYLIQRL